jgi:signal transduction histidine kinase
LTSHSADGSPYTDPMALAGLRPADDRATVRSAARMERVIAVGRAFLTLTGFLAIYLDPTEPARLREVTYTVLASYAFYSVGVLTYVHRRTRMTRRHGRVLHGLDILWTSALTFVSEGPVSPFFLFFLFVVVAAAYRWGFRETAGTAAITVAVFLAETLIVVAGPWQTGWFASIDFELNQTILRVAYLLLTGVLLGYLAEQDKHSRDELAAVADAARQPHINLGLGASMTGVLRMLSNTFRASSLAIVVHDHDTRRTLLWRMDSRDTATPAVRRRQLDEAEHAEWLFADAGRTWHATIDQSGRQAAIIRVTEPDVWPLRRTTGTIPAALLTTDSFRTVTAVNMGLESEWHARAYLFDISERGGLERQLHFLEALAEQVTPGITNVFLLRRLRARAGASERARVARELHDGAIQALFGIEMKVEAIRREARTAPANFEQDLEGIQELLRREVLSLRELMQALRPIELDSSEQLPEVLASLVERFRRDTGISARFVAGRGQFSLSPAKALEVVRIVQEALVNVRKHSRARNVLVRLTAEQGSFALVIEDDGSGFDFEGRLSDVELERRRLGPAIIKERARILGAELAVDSSPGSGTRVELTFTEDVYA